MLRTPVLCINVLHVVNINPRMPFTFLFIFVLLNIFNIIHSMYVFDPVCHDGIMLIFIYCLRILWGMASDRVSCMVMAVSTWACYLPSGLTILSSFSILGEFLPFQIFEEAGESPKHGLFVLFVSMWVIHCLILMPGGSYYKAVRMGLCFCRHCSWVVCWWNLWSCVWYTWTEKLEGYVWVGYKSLMSFWFPK